MQQMLHVLLYATGITDTTVYNMRAYEYTDKAPEVIELDSDGTKRWRYFDHNIVDLDFSTTYEYSLIKAAWNHFIGDTLMMEKEWPEEVNVFEWSVESGKFKARDGTYPTTAQMESMSACFELYSLEVGNSRSALRKISINRRKWQNTWRRRKMERVHRKLLDSVIKETYEKQMQY
jgi:hypothetical protein